MNFFKHFTDAHDGRSMTSLMEEFGLEGYAAYFILMEICAKKLEKKEDCELAMNDCRFAFHERKVREKLRMRSTKVELFLNYCSTLDLLLFTKVDDEFHFYIPKLLEFMDRDSKRARHKRGDSAPKIEDIDKDKEYISIGEIWNSKTKDLPKITDWHIERIRAAARILKTVGKEKWCVACDKVEASEFLSGRSGKWVGADFDWMLVQKNLTKVLNGNYDSREKTGAPIKPSQNWSRMATDAWYSIHAGLTASADLQKLISKIGIDTLSQFDQEDFRQGGRVALLLKETSQMEAS